MLFNLRFVPLLEGVGITLSVSHAGKLRLREVKQLALDTPDNKPGWGWRRVGSQVYRTPSPGLESACCCLVCTPTFPLQPGSLRLVLTLILPLFLDWLGCPFILPLQHLCKPRRPTLLKFSSCQTPLWESLGSNPRKAPKVLEMLLNWTTPRISKGNERL